MPNYRRDYTGTVWFFTVVTHRRLRLLEEPLAASALGRAVYDTRTRFPFHSDAWVLLPDHLHTIWTLPVTDRDYSRRWALIKRLFTQRYRAIASAQPPYWQRRFWAHRIDDDADYRHHMDYIHYNPVKHGLAGCAADWRYSSFHRWVRKGVYPRHWGVHVDTPDGVGHE